MRHPVFLITKKFWCTIELKRTGCVSDTMSFKSASDQYLKKVDY